MTSETVGKLALALAQAQGEIEGAAKDSKNPHYNSRYADLASVWDACRLPLAKHEIAVAQIPSADGSTVRVKTLLMHSSGEWVDGELSAVAKDGSPQSVGSCITYLRRYALASMAGIAPEDDDGEAAQPKKVAYAVDAPRPASRPPDRPVQPAIGSDMPLGPPAGGGGDPQHPLTPAAINEAVLEGYNRPQALTIRRVEKKATKNANVNKYTVVLSDGREVTTIKEPLAAVCEARCQDGVDVTVETKTTKWGEELVMVHTVGEAPPAPPAMLTSDDIPF